MNELDRQPLRDLPPTERVKPAFISGHPWSAYGIYMGVDLALVLGVLPNPEDSAKDLGVFNIANAAPQSLAPFLGAALIATAGGQNYTRLYCQPRHSRLSELSRSCR